MGRLQIGFVRSKIGKKIFLFFLFIIAVPLICISVLSRQLSDFVLDQATDQLLRDSTKSVALNLLDRLRGAESILRIVNTAKNNHSYNADAVNRANSVFSKISQETFNRPSPKETVRVSVATAQDGWPEVSMEIAEAGSSRVIRGTLNRTYLWENLESAYYTLCVGGEEFEEPHCQGPPRPNLSTIEIERPFYFRPYFDGKPWTLLAVAAPDVADYLPIKLGALFAYVAAASLLLTLSVSAFFIRRATTPLDALMLATKAIRNKDFTYVVPVAGMRDEFRDVADSFNVMAATIGDDVAFMEVMARIDEAILAHRPLDSIIRLSLEHLPAFTGAAEARITVVDHFSAARTRYVGNGRSHLVETTFSPGQENAPMAPIDTAHLIAKTDTLSAFIDLIDEPDVAGHDVTSRIEAFKSRLAIAIQSEEHEKVLVARAARDGLTKLLNRLGLVERLAEMIQLSARENRQLAVVYLDLDGFKDVNDAYGHDTGDKLLNMVSDRMSAALLGRDAAIARLGGDEFVFVLPVVDEDIYKKQIHGVLHELQTLYPIDDLRIQIGASLGVAVYPQDGSGHDDLLRNADLAMYEAKSAGRNTVVYFDASFNSSSAERIELRRDLASAIAQRQFHLVYQPRVACSDRSTRSAEALLRWVHPTRGFVPPDKFITLAEDSGLIVDIGYWVLKEAIDQLEKWRATGDIGIEKISVNLSPIQLMHEKFIETVEEIMRSSHVPATSIELEITEGALIRDIETAVAKLRRLQEIGFTIALDDFGVGYSAMSYLSVLPFDTLKIDKSFVSSFGVQKSAYAIASAIVALAQALDKEVVAEGVETAEQADVLSDLGVEELQGYYFSKPLKPDDLISYLNARRADLCT